MFDRLNTITSTLKYHAKQIGTGIFLTGLGVGAYLGFTSAFARKSESDAGIEEINENKYQLSTQRIEEALSKSTIQSFDSIGQLEELTESKQISKLNKNNHDLNKLDNLKLDYRAKSQRSKRAIPVTSEFQVNTYTTSRQEMPAITSLNDGGFIVVWMSDGQDGDSYGVYGQRYNATGNPIDSEFQVNTYTTSKQEMPAVAALNNGGFVVVWANLFENVYGQRYNATGNPISSEFQVSTYTMGNQQYPAVASLTDGGFVVVWASNGQDGDGFGVYGQRYNASNPMGSEFQVNTYTIDKQWYPAIASLINGGFVVVWHSYGQDGEYNGIYGQRFNSSANRIGSEFQINSYTTNYQSNPAITVLNDGGFVVVWHSGGWQDGYEYGIYGQQYNATGNPISSEFQVNTYTTMGQEYPAITGLTDGGFVVVWQSMGQDGDLNGVYGQQYNATGNPIGSEFQVNTYTTDFQAYSAITGLTDERFVVVWQSKYQDGSEEGIYGRIFSSNITTSTPTPQTQTTTTQIQTTTLTTPISTQTSTTIHSGKDDNTTVIASSIIGAIVGITAIAAGITFFAVKRCKRQAHDSHTIENVDLEEQSASMSEREVIRSKQEAISAELSGSYTEIPLFKNDQRQNASSENEEHVATLEQGQIKWSDIQLQRELGSGFFGTVHYALWREATKVAVKQLSNCACGDKELREFRNEARLMATLTHPNIVQFFGIGTRADNGNMFIVMEYMKGGALDNYLYSSRELGWLRRLTIAKNIAAGLDFMHSKEILHRDLRSPNVLLTGKLGAKIADFGLTRLKTKENVADTIHQAFGNPRWMASELFIKGRQYYTAESDIYSYGIILWELVVRKQPYADLEDPMQVPVAVVQGMKNPIPDDCEPKYAELIKWCWNNNPANRPSAKDAIVKLRKIKIRRKSQIIEQQATSSKSFKELSSGYSDGFQ